MLIKILLGVAALAIGIWLGLPGRFEQSSEELEQLMARGGSKRRKVKRHFIAIDRFRKDELASDRRRAENRRRFRTAVSESDPTD